MNTNPMYEVCDPQKMQEMYDKTAVFDVPLQKEHTLCTPNYFHKSTVELSVFLSLINSYQGCLAQWQSSIDRLVFDQEFEVQIKTGDAMLNVPSGLNLSSIKEREAYAAQKYQLELKKLKDLKNEKNDIDNLQKTLVSVEKKLKSRQNELKQLYIIVKEEKMLASSDDAYITDRGGTSTIPIEENIEFKSSSKKPSEITAPNQLEFFEDSVEPTNTVEKQKFVPSEKVAPNEKLKNLSQKLAEDGEDDKKMSKLLEDITFCD